jgi:hypothetical protein
VDAGFFHLLEEVAGTVGGVAVDSRLALARDRTLAGRARSPARTVVLIAGQQPGGGLGVPAVSRGDSGGGDDLRIRVNRDMPLVSIEAAGGGLVPVAGLRVNGRDDPVRGDRACLKA